MSFRASISVNPSASSKLDELERKVRARASRALNDGAQDWIDETLSTIAAETSIASIDKVRASVLLERATEAELRVSITVRETPLLLAEFRPASFSGGLVVNARVGRPPQRIPGGFLRDGLALVRVGKGVRLLWGPSTSNLFEDAAGLVVDAVADRIRNKLK